MEDIPDDSNAANADLPLCPTTSHPDVLSVGAGNSDESPTLPAEGSAHSSDLNESDTEPDSESRPPPSSADATQLLPVVDAPRINAIAEQQRQDPELSPILSYLVDGRVPEERKLARKLVMERSRFDIIDGILYYENPDVEGKWLA